MSLTITATEYQARVLNTQGQAVTSLRQLLEQRLLVQGIVFLDPLTERQLWLKAVEEPSFINKEALATECAEAYHTMLLYGITPEELYGFDAEGVSLFRKIFKRFLKRKDQPIFLEALQNLRLQQPIELFGFADLPPLYRNCFVIPVETGIQNDILDPRLRREGSVKKIYQAPNPETEFLGALAEIDKLWQVDPHKTFALVIQQNVLSWPKIYRLLKTHPVAIPYACSKSEVWGEQPKFLFLKQLLASVTTTDLLAMSRVLLSPFWPDDLERRAKLDVWMRDNLLRTTSLTEVLQSLLAQDPSIQETQWFQAWNKLAHFNVKDVAEFSDAFLTAAAMSVIPTEAETQQPHLHIVSTLEAVDLPVDAVWLLSADNDHYPLRRSPPAFLPKSLLVRKGIHVTIEAMREYGARIFDAITAGKEVYASFVPQVKGEERRLSEFIDGKSRASPLPLRERVRVRGNEIKFPSSGASHHLLPQGEKEIISGGSQLLKEQAECPFKAFTHYRLQVNALGSGRELLDPLQKGLLVHAALEKIWDELKSQQALLALHEEGRRALVARKVDAVLFTRKNTLLSKLERERLIRVLTDWLNLEAARVPFEVEACELNAMVNIGGLQLRLRLDRVDRIGGSRIIIDYKTGEISSKGWFEERLREPQLPLYVVTNAAHGAIFASLKVGKMAYAGVVKDSACAFDQVKVLKDWEKQTARWQEQLEALALEFATNYAEVKPVDDKVCTYCDLSSFCRIKEQA